MITVDDLRAVPLFASVPTAELERLARSAADLHVTAGEYIVNEGDPRALYIILEGRCDVRKTVAGGERTVGTRTPGMVFGEVPIILGSPILATLCATEPSRIARFSPREVHLLEAAAPEVTESLGALARDRIEGLEDLAANDPLVTATVYGARWDGRCQQLRSFLERNLVRFDWAVADDEPLPEHRDDWAALGSRLPAVRIRGGPLLAQPELREVARALSLTTEPHAAEYDTAIIGGGPTGLAAAVYGASEGLRTVMIEREAPGGQAGTSSRIENYLGFPTGVSGDELANRALQQAKRFGAEIIVTRSVVGIDVARHSIELDGGTRLNAKSIILASGVAWRRLAFEGCDRLLGRGIYYGSARGEASSMQGEDVYFVGAGNSAGQAALYFAGYARSVTLVVRGPDLSASMSHYLVQQLKLRPNIEFLHGCEVVGASGNEHLESIEIRERVNGNRFRRNTSGLFVCIGADAETSWLPPEIVRDEKGYILTGPDAVKSGAWPLDRHPFLLETTVPGIFACGDVRHDSVKRVASGVGEGSMSIAFVHQFLRPVAVPAS